MDSRYYNRPLSPGGRRLVVPERASTGTFPAPYDSYYPIRSRDPYVSPRTSGERVIQPSSQYSQHSSSTSTGGRSSYESYSGRPRRSTLTDAEAKRPNISTANLSAAPARTSTRPVIHTTLDRPSSPLTRVWDDRNPGYVTPGVTVPRREHKKTYSVDSSGHSKLIDERDVDHRRRESAERSAYRNSGIGGSRKGYHLSGPLSRPPEVTDDNYSYTDPAGMYRDTEPRWRQRRGSVDRGSRPTSMMDGIYGLDPRKSRESGPPPTTRGLDKINDKLAGGLSRGGSLRDHARTGSRDRSSAYYHDQEYLPPRSATVHQEREDRYPYHEERQSRSHAPRYEDPDVATRGFGIRSGSIDRYATRTSDDSLDRDPLYPSDGVIKQPDVRDYIPPPPPREDRRDREYPERERADRERRDWERRRDTDRDRRDYEERDHRVMSGAIPAAAAAVAAYGVGEAIDRQTARDRRYEEPPEENRQYHQKLTSSDSTEPARERHYETERDRRDERKKESRKEPTTDPDEEYRRRVQQEMERSGLSGARDRDSDSDRERRRRGRDRDRDRERSSTRDRSRDVPREPPRDAPRDTGRETARDVPRESLRERSSREEEPPAQPPRPSERRDERQNSVFGGPVVQEPGEMPDPDADKKVKIVDPPRESPPPPKGILKQPTEKFPEDPNPIREGVAPLKDAKKGKDIPPDARWTKIDRRLVNPEALEEAKERFEERMDCVIVLRVLTKDEIQKLADRTTEIRESREYERDRRDRHRDRDRDHDRDRDRDRERRHRRRDYDTSGDSYDEYDDEYDRDHRDRDRDRPRAIEGPPGNSTADSDRRGYPPGSHSAR